MYHILLTLVSDTRSLPFGMLPRMLGFSSNCSTTRNSNSPKRTGTASLSPNGVSTAYSVPHTYEEADARLSADSFGPTPTIRAVSEHIGKLKQGDGTGATTVTRAPKAPKTPKTPMSAAAAVVKTEGDEGTPTPAPAKAKATSKSPAKKRKRVADDGEDEGSMSERSEDSATGGA